ncbi:MAG TPA: hypothetical protein VF449_13405 [Parvibaculum sp.]
MTRLIAAASKSEARFWVQDLAALVSIGAFIWVAGTWAAIAQAALVG